MQKSPDVMPSIKYSHSFVHVDWDLDYNQYRGFEGNIDAALFVPTTNCEPQCIGNTFFFSVSKTHIIKKINKTIDFFQKLTQSTICSITEIFLELHFETTLPLRLKSEN